MQSVFSKNVMHSNSCPSLSNKYKIHFVLVPRLFSITSSISSAHKFPFTSWFREWTWIGFFFFGWSYSGYTCSTVWGLQPYMSANIQRSLIFTGLISSLCFLSLTRSSSHHLDPVLFNSNALFLKKHAEDLKLFYRLKTLSKWFYLLF